MEKDMITWEDFTRVEMRVGTIISAEPFDKANKPAYLIFADFGNYGIKKTSAQVTTLYDPAELVGKQIVGVLNFPRKQIANIQSEFLLMGAMDGQEVTLLNVDRPVRNGVRVG